MSSHCHVSTPVPAHHWGVFWWVSILKPCCLDKFCFESLLWGNFYFYLSTHCMQKTNTAFSYLFLKGQYKKAISSLHHLAALQGSHSPQQITGQGSLENQRALIQLATCHFALGEYRVRTTFHRLVLHRLALRFPFVFFLWIFSLACFQEGIKHKPGSSEKFHVSRGEELLFLVH